ncbi:MAG: AAA family ATPase [Nocardioidaceae bacterium]
MTIIVEVDSASAEALGSAVGAGTIIVPGLEQLRRHLDVHPGEFAVILGPSVDQAAAVALADTLRVTKPALGVILVRRRIDTAVLGDALRAGMREVVEERDLTGLNDAVSRVYSLHVALTSSDGPQAEAGQPKGMLITVFSAKGGVGKTTISTNLAAAMADGGKRSVCIVDLDLAFGDVSIVMQLFPVHSIADALTIDRKLDPAAVEALLTEHSPGLKVLAAPVQPEAKDRINGELVGNILRILKDQFDVVVVDTPPAFDEVVLTAFDDSDLIVLVGTLDVPALKSLKITSETLGLLNHPRDKWRFVLNRADMKVGLTPSEVEKTLDLRICAAIPQSNDVPASINQGRPIVLESPRHAVSQVIKKLAVDCIGSAAAAERTESNNAPEATSDARRGGGLLRRRAAK